MNLFDMIIILLQFPSSSEKSSGVFESLISAMIFFLPNMLLVIPYIRVSYSYFIFLIYNYVIIFILVSAIANLKFQE